MQALLYSSYNYQYVYFIWGLALLPLATYLYSKIRNYPEMLRVALVAGLLGIFIGPIVEIAYFYDYWTPETIFPTFKIGHWFYTLEDSIWGALFGFSTVAFVELFHGYRKNITNSYTTINKKLGIRTVLIGIITILSTIMILFIFGVNSFLATIFACTLYVIISWKNVPRKTTRNAIVFGLLLTITMLLVNLFLGAIFPGWIEKFYMFRNTPEIIFLGIMPIDDVFWFLFVSITIYILSVRSVYSGYSRF